MTEPRNYLQARDQALQVMQLLNKDSKNLFYEKEADLVSPTHRCCLCCIASHETLHENVKLSG